MQALNWLPGRALGPGVWLGEEQERLLARAPPPQDWLHRLQGDQDSQEPDTGEKIGQPQVFHATWATVGVALLGLTALA